MTTRSEMLMHFGYRSRGERLLGFFVGVALCCFLSGCLSILAKNGRDQSMASTRTARLATPHDDASMTLSESLDGRWNGDRVSREKGRIPSRLKTAAILCIAAAICCAITAIGAILLIRSPRESYRCISEEESSEEYVNVMNRSSLAEITAACKSRTQICELGEQKKITPEEAV